MYLVALKVGADGSTNRRKEFFFAESGEKAKSLEFVFYGIFELSEAQLNSDVKQRLVYVGERIGSGYVYAGDCSAATTTQRTGDGDFATASRMRSLKNSAFAKNKGASQRKRTRPGIWRALG